jgi:hypothetical protein
MKGKTRIMEIWDDDCETSTLVARVEVERDKVKDFIKKVNHKYLYRVEQAEPVVSAEVWLKMEAKLKKLQQKQMKEYHENMSEGDKILSDYWTTNILESCKPMFPKLFKGDKEK